MLEMAAPSAIRCLIIILVEGKSVKYILQKMLVIIVYTCIVYYITMNVSEIIMQVEMEDL